VESPLHEGLTPYPQEGVPIQRRTGAEKIDEDQWRNLAIDLWQVVTTSYSARQTLEDNFRLWNSLYEMETPDDAEGPWEDASDVFIPMVPAKLEALRDQVIALTFVPEFYLVTGFGDEGQKHARTVQTWANNMFRKQRGNGISSWFKAHITWLHLGLFYGTSVMEVMWRKVTRQSVFGVEVPVLGADDTPMFDDDGNAVMETHDVPQEEIVYNAPYVRPVMLRDFILIPDEAINIEDAVGVAKTEWLYESDLKAMVHEGLLNDDWVERALSFVPVGESDVTSDRQGIYDKTMGGQLNIGQGQGQLVSEFFKNRGPIKVWRIHTRQFDMNGDGIPEENVFWIHEISQYMLGWCPERYIAPSRPFFAFSPFPRADRFYGYSLVERLGGLNAEINNKSNQRNNAIDRAILPPTLIDRTEEIWDKGFSWGINKSWGVRDPAKAIFIPTMPEVPLADFQQESSYNTWADQVSGLSAPLTGGMSSGRRSATEVKESAGSSQVRASEIAMELRLASRGVLDYVVSLLRQYPWDPQPGDIPVTREILSLPFVWNVAGISDPLDQQTFADEVLGAYNLLQKDPDVQSDAVLRYNLKRMVLEAIGIPNVETVLGTPEDAEKRKESEQQANQEKQQMEKTAFAADIYHKTNGAMNPAAQNGAAGGPPQPPQNGAPGGPGGGAPQGAPAPAAA
jgi:hypothetical protein